MSHAGYMLVNYCHWTYSWFLSVFWLLSFKECITWLLSKGWIRFSRKTYRIMCHSKENFMPINICKGIYNWFLSFYWPSKNESCDQDVKGEFVSLARRFVFGTTGKRILCWSIIAVEPGMILVSVSGLLTFSGSRDHDVKGEFVSLAKPIVFGTTVKTFYLG